MTVSTYLSSPLLTLIAFAGVLGVLIALRFGVVVLLVILLISLPLGRVTILELGPITVSPLMAVIVVLVGVWLWGILAGSRMVRPSWVQIPLAILVLWGTIGLYWAPDKSLTLKTLLIFSMGAAVYVITSEAVHSENEVRTIVWAVLGIMGAVGLYTVVTYIEGSSGISEHYVISGSERYYRAEGIFTHPNYLGTFMALTIPPGIALATAEAIGWRKVLAYSLLAAAIAGLLLTYSRGGWIGAGVGLLISVLLLQRRFSLLLSLSFIGTLSFIGIIVSLVSPAVILERLASVGNASTDVAVIPRLEAWSAAPKLVAEHALLGTGLGNFGPAYANLLGMTPVLYSLPDWYVYAANRPTQYLPHAHNLFLNLAIELGLVGLAAFMWLLVLASLKAWRIRCSTTLRQERFLSVGILGGFVAMSVANMVDTTFYQGFIIIVFFIFLGLLEAMERIDKN
jgi:putative inorganic carbon (hco3(-)) transporter